MLDYLAEVRPSWFFAVPRIWEKLQTRAEALLAEAPMYAPASLADAIEKVRLEQRGEPVPSQLASRVAEADERTFYSVRTALGLDRANCHIGAAPAAPELIEFFLALGVGLSEIYGMSETTGAGTMNPPDAPRIGSAGKAVRNLELKLADDGEILVRGPIMMTPLPQPARTRPRRATPRTAGSSRATSARSTTTATSASSTARRSSSSTRPARTCRRRTSSPRSRARAR